MRIAVLWTELSGYMNACLKELAGREGVKLFVAHQMAKTAPFDDQQFAWISERLTWHTNADLGSLGNRLEAFQPEILLFCSWSVPGYRRTARKLANKCWRVMGMDNCWLGTMKQRLGICVSPFYLHPMTDAVWLPGERQSVFARKLGFQQRAILRGLYSCDQPAIERLHVARLKQGRTLARSFLFIGRFVRAKGLDTLVRAYEAYREASANPWPLVCCGSGPLRRLLENKAGIHVEGFVQPERLPNILASSGCLVLPSKFEPWAVVVHEAASAGLPILASERVGAAAHLVQPNYNGFIFGSGDAKGLASLMARMSGMSNARLDAMSRASHLLSQQFTPSRWANTLLESFRAHQDSPEKSAIVDPTEIESYANTEARL